MEIVWYVLAGVAIAITGFWLGCLALAWAVCEWIGGDR